MDSSLFKKLRETRFKILKPKSKMDLVEWADTYRFLSAESSSEPGRFKTSRVEASRSAMLALTNPKYKKVTVQACTQLMKTEIINNLVGYHIHQDPCPIIVMQPTVGLAETWSEDRLAPMIRDTPVLKSQVVEKKSRDSGNTKDKKGFPGGYVAMIGANSPTELASRPVRIVLCDEVDKYPRSAGKEGDPIKLISERSATFWNSKIAHVCSPTNEGSSRINEEYNLSNQTVLKTDCPHCGEIQELEWSSVSWDEGKPDTAQYYCPECGEGWSEAERIKSLSQGRLIEVITRPEVTDHYGIKVSKMYSPWETMAELAKKYEEAKDDPEKMKTFVNTQLAETFKDAGDAPEWEKLYRRRELYKVGEVPGKVLFLTAGVDIQKDRIEMEVTGWCRNRESYLVDYQVIDGDTEKDDVWEKLEESISYLYRHESGGELPIKLTAIDSGYRTQIVYGFVKRMGSMRVRAIKGNPNLSIPIGMPSAVDVTIGGRKMRRGLKLWPVGINVLKSELYAFLRKEIPVGGEYPKGFCHFPELDQEYFKQLTAEQLVATTDKNNYTKYEWTKSRARNEALDCRVYSTFCSIALGILRFEEKHWKKFENELGIQHSLDSDGPKDSHRPKPQKKKRRNSSFW